VMACVVGFEYLAEWLVRWIPLYYFFKTIFLMFLALPQTQGSSFIYQVHLGPLLHAHETQIDAALTKFKVKIYEFIQEKLRILWNQVAGSAGATSAATQAGGASGAVGAANPPTMSDPLSGAAQMVSGLWSTYAPAIIANGAAYIASRQQQAAAAAAQNRQQATQPRPQESTESLQTRRRALEAELAALPQPAPSTTLQDPFRAPSGTSLQSNSSTVSISPQDATRRRTESVATSSSQANGSGSDAETRYENIGRDDIGSGDERPMPGARTSWWGGWRSPSYQGYERVKDE